MPGVQGALCDPPTLCRLVGTGAQGTAANESPVSPTRSLRSSTCPRGAGKLTHQSASLVKSLISPVHHNINGPQDQFSSVSQALLVVKNPPASAGDRREVGSIPGSGRSPGGGNGHPLQYSCLENPIDRGAWRATAYGVTKSRT